jgi:hypothetical protein
MNLTEMIGLVRRDLHDEDPNNYRWTDDELKRHIAHAVKDISEALPLEQKAQAATTAGSREISLASLTGLVMVERVEYPVGRFPAEYPQFALWNSVLTVLGETIPDGSDCRIYYGQLHTLDVTTSTLPAKAEELVIAGACGYAAQQMAGFTINRINAGGTGTPDELTAWGKAKLAFFRSELKRLHRNNRVRLNRLYTLG